MKTSREHSDSNKSCDVSEYNSSASTHARHQSSNEKCNDKNILYSAQIVEKVSMKTKLCANQIAANRIYSLLLGAAHLNVANIEHELEIVNHNLERNISFYMLNSSVHPHEYVHRAASSALCVHICICSTCHPHECPTLRILLQFSSAFCRYS